jgi:hypothetical protein
MFSNYPSNVKGSYRVEGHYIVDADITVKSLKWNKGTSYKYSISNQNPFKLTQVIRITTITCD